MQSRTVGRIGETQNVEVERHRKLGGMKSTAPGQAGSGGRGHRQRKSGRESWKCEVDVPKDDVMRLDRTGSN